MSIVIPAPKIAERMSFASRSEARMVYFGTPLFAVPALRRLVKDGWPIAAVITAPDRPVGRRMLMTPSPVKSAALELGLPVWTPASLKDEQSFSQYAHLNPLLGVVVAYGKLIPARYLEQTSKGFLNIHPSLLPAYRGPSPIQSAILDGCSGTGVTLMQLDNEMDHGPIVAQQSWTIPGGFDAPLCEDELSRIGAELLVQSLPGYLDGSLRPQPQQHEAATFTKKFDRQDGRLDWSLSAADIVNRIRALGANPGTWTLWNDSTLNIFHAHVHEPSASASAAGTVSVDAGELIVHCGTGAVALEVIQLEGSTKQSARDFRNGHQGIVGAILM